MGDRENDELLPDGWRVEFRVRKNGKKDKIIIEKASAEGLPPGWTKEIKVAKIGHKVRRDPYYIDPVSGYIFRSMKDAVRYVETGKIGRLAFKPKDDGNQEEEELEDDKDNSTTAAKKQKLVVTRKEADITGQSTKLSEETKDEDALDSASTGEHISRSEHTYGQGEAGTESRVTNLSEAKDSDKMDEGKDSDKNVLSTPAVGVLPHRQSSDSGQMGNETKKTPHEKSRSRKKKALDLPRRASRRLAGLALNPTPELKTNNQACRAVAEQSDEIEPSTVEDPCSGSQVLPASQQLDQPEAKPEANCALDTSKSIEVSSKSSDRKHFSGDQNGPSGKIEMEYMSNQNQKPACAVILPLQNQDKIETDIEAEKKPLIDFPFEDLLSDPCIAFAIKTLTGETFETSSDKVVLQESNSTKSEGLATLQELDGKPRENKGDKKQENVATPVEQAANVESNLKADEKLENPLDLPFMDIWRDPCIEFAIKTLTGTIPVENDLDVQDYFQQQLNSSQTQPSNNL